MYVDVLIIKIAFIIQVLDRANNEIKWNNKQEIVWHYTYPVSARITIILWCILFSQKYSIMFIPLFSNNTGNLCLHRTSRSLFVVEYARDVNQHKDDYISDTLYRVQFIFFSEKNMFILLTSTIKSQFQKAVTE